MGKAKIYQIESIRERGRCSPHERGSYEYCIKRPLDFLLALLALVLLSPLMAVLALLVRVKLGSPVLFRQERPGFHGKIFTIYKFRTMTDQRDACGELLPDQERLTRFGRVLRETSLDELPELICILRGSMAVVGPRPLLVEYLPLYTKYQNRRHEVRPGFTGYAQVNGRNDISWEEKFDKDVYYVDHIGFFMDAWIILKTVGVVLKRQGIHSQTSDTMDDFKGTGK